MPQANNAEAYAIGGSLSLFEHMLNHELPGLACYGEILLGNADATLYGDTVLLAVLNYLETITDRARELEVLDQFEYYNHKQTILRARESVGKR